MEKTFKFINWLRRKSLMVVTPQFIEQSESNTITEYFNILYLNFINDLLVENQKLEYDSNGVTKPEQYQIGIDTFERAEANLSKEEILAICKFNIDKYNWRKKDQDKEDFQKIIDYANWAIKQL